MANFMDMIKKAKEGVLEGSDGEWLKDHTRGEILIHNIKFYETDKGKWGALIGELTKSEPTEKDVVAQAPGTQVKVIWKCHGDYPMIGYEALYKCIKAVFNPADDAEMNRAVTTCLGSDESKFTNKASSEDRKEVFFAARGLLVGFLAKPSKNSEERKKKGLHTFTDITWSHIEPKSLEEVLERQKKIPQI